MSKADLEIALVQTDLAWQDPERNRAHFADLLTRARGADLIVLPEMFTTGFSMESAELAEDVGGTSTAWMLRQAQALDAVVTGSLIIRAGDGRHYNRLLWARPDGSLAHYDKRHLFRMAGEHKHYTAGDRQALFEVNGWRVRPLICYDLRFPVWSRDPYDTDLLVYTANWPAARRQHWNRLLPRGRSRICATWRRSIASVPTARGIPTAATARCWISRATPCWRPRPATACSAPACRPRASPPTASASRPTRMPIRSPSAEHRPE